MRDSLPHEDVTRPTIGCFYRVYRALGFGLPESHYAAALAIELADAGLFFQRELAIDVRYKGQLIGQFRADFVVERCVILELKAGPTLDQFALRRLFTYLRTSEYEVGLLLYFGPEPLVRRLDCPDHLKGQTSRRDLPAL